MSESSETTAIVHATGPATALLTYQRFAFRAATGPAPMTQDKREGDGATPIGLLPIRRIFYRADRTARPIAAQTIQVTPLAPNDGWCDDPRHADYNCAVRLPHEASCETLWREPHEYDIIAVLGWNDAAPVPGRGSAIFLHLPTRSGITEGCVALEDADLRALLAAGVTALDIRG